MSLTNTTLDDQSSYISYSDGWNGTAHDDLWVGDYYQSTYHGTNVSGSTFTFSWTGTDIWLFGAKRLNHGYASVSIDGSDKVYFSTYANPDQWQVVNWQSSFLAEGDHQVVVACEEGYGNNVISDGSMRWFDLDYLVVRGTPISPSTTSSISSSTPTSTTLASSPISQSSSQDGFTSSLSLSSTPASTTSISAASATSISASTSVSALAVSLASTAMNDSGTASLGVQANAGTILTVGTPTLQNNGAFSTPTMLIAQAQTQSASLRTLDSSASNWLGLGVLVLILLSRLGLGDVD